MIGKQTRTTHPCDEDNLSALLQDGEQATNHELILEHLEQCVRCQQRFDELAAASQDWTKARQALSIKEPTVELDGDANRWHYPPNIERSAVAWTESMAQHLLSPPSHPEMLGRIGRYDVERLIGSGGMGVVFKAYDTELNRPVAVKLLAPFLAESGSARKRFSREARAAAAVVDQHVVAIHNVESGDGPGKQPFLVMKYIAGGSLQQRLDRDGPLEVCEILRIGMQTAKGLAAAHAQGLIHRDVKPSNILLDEGVDRALLTDFGLARAEDDAGLTRSGFHPGTPHYMSPEQVRGEAIDGRSDLFSLGCVLYALCTGHPPFRAETSYAVLRRITDDTARPIREINPDVPEWLEQIVMKLLSKCRDDRFDSAVQVAELLEGCLAHVQHPTLTPLPNDVSNTLQPASPVFRFRVTGILVMIASLSSIALMLFMSAAEQKDIVDTADAAGSFKTLVAAVKAADLIETLKGEGPFTVFAPTDEAFAKLPKGTVEELLKLENKDKLAELLKDHVISGKVTLGEALQAGEAATLQGSSIPAKFAGGRVLIGPAGLLEPDIAASNGVIHVIDQVLLPKTWGESNVQRFGPFPYPYGKLVSFRYAYCPAPEKEKQDSRKVAAAQSCNKCHVLPAANFPEMWRNLYVGFDPKKEDAECANPNLFRWVKSGKGAGAMFGKTYAVYGRNTWDPAPPAPVTVKVGQEFDVELYTFINQEGARWYPGARPRHAGEEEEGFNINGPNKTLPEITNESVLRVGEISKLSLSAKPGETYDVCYSDSKFGEPTAGAFFNPDEKFGTKTTCGKYLVRYRAVKAGMSEIRWQLYRQREDGKGVYEPGLDYFAEYVLPVNVE